ncbi:MAG: hypothetical protein MRQ12_02225 [Candidatus Midichloria mitochondrii]|nr:hypothetical protein [Candidatus Midichloria mitochondrii]
MKNKEIMLVAQEYLSKCAVDTVVVSRVYTEFANRFIQHFDIFKLATFSNDRAELVNRLIKM